MIHDHDRKCGGGSDGVLIMAACAQNTEQHYVGRHAPQRLGATDDRSHPAWTALAAPSDATNEPPFVSA
jgi:hypothetical protein